MNILAFLEQEICFLVPLSLITCMSDTSSTRYVNSRLTFSCQNYVVPTGAGAITLVHALCVNSESWSDSPLQTLSPTVAACLPASLNHLWSVTITPGTQYWHLPEDNLVSTSAFTPHIQRNSFQNKISNTENQLPVMFSDSWAQSKYDSLLHAMHLWHNRLHEL